MNDDPAYLAVGTEVSAKFKGAFCEAKIRKIIVRSIKCKVLLKETPFGSFWADEQQVRGLLQVNQIVEVLHNGSHLRAQVQCVKDGSKYHVVFDDGDEKTLGRNNIVLKGAKHYNEAHNLDALPLYNPEQFSSPVVAKIVGKNKDKKRESRSSASLAGSAKKERPETPEESSDEEPSTSRRWTMKTRGRVRRKEKVEMSDAESVDKPRRKKRSKRAAANLANVAIADQDDSAGSGAEVEDNEESGESDSNSRAPPEPVRRGRPPKVKEEKEKEKEKETPKKEREKDEKKRSKEKEVKESEKEKEKEKERPKETKKFHPGDVVYVYEEPKRQGKVLPAVVVNAKIYRQQKTVKPLHEGEIPMRVFLNGRFRTAGPEYVYRFIGKIPKTDSSPLKLAFQRAKDFSESNGKIKPPNWNLKEDILGNYKMKKELSSSSSEYGSSSSDDEDNAKRDLFVAHFYKFQEENATPINKQPVLGGKALDLFKFYHVVRRMGGHRKVTQNNKWKKVVARMKLEGCSGANANTVKNAYMRYLAGFCKQYASLGYSLTELGSHSSTEGRRRLLFRAGTVGPGERDKEKGYRRKATSAEKDDDKDSTKKDRDERSSADTIKAETRKSIEKEKSLSMEKDKEKAKEVVERATTDEEELAVVEQKPDKAELREKMEREAKEKEKRVKEEEASVVEQRKALEEKREEKEKEQEKEKEKEKEKKKREISESPARSLASTSSDRREKEDEKEKERRKERKASQQPVDYLHLQEPDANAKRERSIAPKECGPARKDRRRTDSVSTHSDEETRKRKEKRKSISIHKERSAEKDGKQLDDTEEGFMQTHLLCQFRQGQNIRALHHGSWYNARVLTSEFPKMDQLLNALRLKPGESPELSPENIEKLKALIKETQALVHYLGWNSRYDEWIQMHKIRISIKDEEEARSKVVAALGSHVTPERIKHFLEWSSSEDGVDSFRRRDLESKRSFLASIGPYRPRRFSISQVQELSDTLQKQSAKDNKDRDVSGPCSGAPGPSYSNVTSVSSRPPQTHSGSGVSSSVSPLKETAERMEKGEKHSHREKENDKEQMSTTTTTASSVKTASKVIVSSAGPSAPTTRSSPTKDVSPVKDRREELRTSVSASEPPRRVRTPAKDTHATSGAASPRTAAQMDVRVGQRGLDVQSSAKLTPAPAPLVRASTPLKERGLGISTLTGPDGTITHTLPGGQPVAPTMNVRDFVEANLKEKKREAEVERQRRQEEERKKKVESESHLQQKEREEREKAEHEKMKKLKEKEERERKKEEERKRKEEEERRKKKEKEEAEKRKRQEEEERRKKKEEEEAKKREEEERRRKKEEEERKRKAEEELKRKEEEAQKKREDELRKKKEKEEEEKRKRKEEEERKKKEEEAKRKAEEAKMKEKEEGKMDKGEEEEKTKKESGKPKEVDAEKSAKRRRDEDDKKSKADDLEKERKERKSPVPKRPRRGMVDEKERVVKEESADETDRLLQEAKSVCVPHTDDSDVPPSGSATPRHEGDDDADKWSVSDSHSTVGGVMTSPSRGHRGKRKRGFPRGAPRPKKTKDDENESHENNDNEEESEGDQEVETFHRETFVSIRKAMHKVMEADGSIENYQQLGLPPMKYSFDMVPTNSAQLAAEISDYVFARMEDLRDIYDPLKKNVVETNKKMMHIKMSESAKKTRRERDSSSCASPEKTPSLQSNAKE